MISSKKIIPYLLALLIIFSTAYVAVGAPLEVTSDGQVSVETTLNIKSILHIDQSSAPSNPVSGDIYFSTTEELLIFANGKWKPIFSAAAQHGSKTLSGSGTWTVPAGIYSVRVSLTGGGGGGGPTHIYYASSETQCSSGGSGGKGGVLLDQVLDVVPGQQLSYTVGNGGTAGFGEFCGPYAEGGNGGTTTFGSHSASGGAGGTATSSGSNGSPSGSYPYAPYGSGGNGLVCNSGTTVAGAGSSGSIYIQY